jgi:hypothetical protein
MTFPCFVAAVGIVYQQNPTIVKPQPRGVAMIWIGFLIRMVGVNLNETPPLIVIGPEFF